MNYYDNNYKDQIKDSIVAYLQATRGITILGNKPFQCVFAENHKNNDSHPSMSLRKDSNGTYKCHCFACNEDIDTLDLIMYDNNCSYTEAYKIGLDFIGKNSFLIKKITPQKKEIPFVVDEEIDFTKDAIELNSSLQGNIIHFMDRGLSEHIINSYKLGYSALGWNYAFRNFPSVQSKSIKQEAYKYYFCNFSKEGRIDYVFSEIEDRNLCDEYNKKYKFPKGISKPVFNERYLYSENQTIFIVEGTYDCLSLEEIGMNAIALLGTGNKRLCHIIADNTSNNKYIILMDNDESGKKASSELETEFNRLGIMYVVAKDFYPEGIKDCNEYLIKDREGFINKAKLYTSKAVKTQITNFKEKVKERTYEYIPTGIKAIDTYIEGLNKQELVVVESEAGIGKTTLCQQIAENFASKGRKVLYFNLEMSVEQLIARSLSRILGTCLENYTMSPVDILQGYKWNSNQEDLIDSAIYLYESSHLSTNLKYIDSSTNCCEWDKIYSEMKKEAEEHKKKKIETPIIVLDYLHLIQGRNSEDNATTIKRIVAQSKEYALKYDSIVILISAISKADSGKKDDSSVMEGRDTTAIGYSADKIFKLYTPDESKTPSEIGGTTSKGTYKGISLNVLKNRMGKANQIIPLKFYKEFGYFE